ncbi:hypothetical protein [Mycobacteroides abscessus]|uniref:hypothetical protein n=1 Tax=Mycobacteroides abscessus TaxID=36809 RepID=UPI001F2DF8B7|nr:hypothetical protein [Mycobacteroides abscessus]
MPEVGPLEDLALGEGWVPDGLAPEMRFDKVGFTACGFAVGAGVAGVLGGSTPDGLVARGIGGS